MRRYVLGVELVAADAEASVFGRIGTLRKDSRGLDTVHLAVGSGGTLGVVTRAAVALVALPRSRQTWWLAIERPAATVELLAHLDRLRPGSISAFEFVSREAMARTLAAPGAPANPFGAVITAAVLAEWSFAGDAADGIEDDIAAAADSRLITDGRLVDTAAAWGLRHRVSDSLRTFGVVLGHDVSVPRSSLMDVRQLAIDAVAALAPLAVMCDFGHVGDGGLHLNVLFPTESGPPTDEQRVAIRRSIDDLVTVAGGSYSAEHGLGPLNADRWLATTPVIEQRVVGALKDTLDPLRILGHPAHPYNRS
jgi:FAD/FMN-containing dehydrogenase